MNGYSKDLRLKVLDAVERGIPRREAARLFGVSLSTIKRYIERRREGGDLSPRLSPRPRGPCGRSWKPTTMPPWSVTASCGSRSAA
jgi:transposase